MKIFLIALLCGISAAAVVRDDHLLLQQVLGVFDEALSNTEKHFADVQASSKLGDFFRDALENLVDRIKDSVDKIKDVTERLTDKVEELNERLRELGEKAKSKSEETVELLKEKIKNIVKSIQDSIHKQVSVIGRELDEASYLRVRDLLTILKQRISQKVEDIRQYIKETSKDNIVTKDIDRVLKEIEDSDISDLWNNLLDLSGNEVRHLKELYQKLKDLASRTDGVLKSKLESLLGYLENLWKRGIEELLTKYQNMKSKLLEVVDKSKDFSIDAVKDALRQLEDYKQHLGDLYSHLVESLKKVIYKF